MKRPSQYLNWKIHKYQIHFTCYDSFSHFSCLPIFCIQNYIPNRKTPIKPIAIGWITEFLYSKNRYNNRSIFTQTADDNIDIFSFTKTNISIPTKFLCRLTRLFSYERWSDVCFMILKKYGYIILSLGCGIITAVKDHDAYLLITLVK